MDEKITVTFSVVLEDITIGDAENISEALYWICRSVPKLTSLGYVIEDPKEVTVDVENRKD